MLLQKWSTDFNPNHVVILPKPNQSVQQRFSTPAACHVDLFSRSRPFIHSSVQNFECNTTAANHKNIHIVLKTAKMLFKGLNTNFKALIMETNWITLNTAFLLRPLMMQKQVIQTLPPNLLCALNCLKHFYFAPVFWRLWHQQNMSGGNISLRFT